MEMVLNAKCINSLSSFSKSSSPKHLRYIIVYWIPKLKMEFLSWFVRNRRCFVCFCVCVFVFCVRFYSKFKMLTTESLLNKHCAHHFVAFEYLEYFVCVLMFVWWIFEMRRNMKCIFTCDDCRIQQHTIHRTHCMITKTFVCMMHGMAWKHSDPTEILYIFPLLLLYYNKNYKWNELQALNCTMNIYYYKFIFTLYAWCDLMMKFHEIFLHILYTQRTLCALYYARHTHAHSLSPILHMQWILNFRFEELICGPSEIIKLKIRE